MFKLLWFFWKESGFKYVAKKGGWVRIGILHCNFVKIKMFTKVSALADIHAPIFGPVFS